jgi:NADH:ubiquinone oxidoreductase subunit 4 (subunit M)
LFIFPEFNLSYFGAIDAISIIFIMLTAFIFPLVFLSQSFFYSVRDKADFFMYQLICAELIIINSFFVLDLLLFFVFFEALIFPIYILIGVWGPRSRKLKANSYFLLYTIVTSCFLFFGLILVYSELGSTLYFDILLYRFSLKKELFL